jgi:predicted metal-binding membrane protein
MKSKATLFTGAALLLLAGLAWVAVVRQGTTMIMPSASASLREGMLFTLQWGVMMTAMMLPSALPMMLLYRTVSTRLVAERNARVIPPAVFVTLYLVLWLLTGVPVYALGVMFLKLSPGPATITYFLASVLVLAGIYQLSPLKRACLRQCVSPMSFLMRRWRSAYAATFNIAARHALYCIGCCWALMVILVAAGAMSLPWVLAISVIVFAEKVLPYGRTTARVVGVLLIVLGAALVIQPELSAKLRPEAPILMSM